MPQKTSIKFPKDFGQPLAHKALFGWYPTPYSLPCSIAISGAAVGAAAAGKSMNIGRNL